MLRKIGGGALVVMTLGVMSMWIAGTVTPFLSALMSWYWVLWILFIVLAELMFPAWFPASTGSLFLSLAIGSALALFTSYLTLSLPMLFSFGDSDPFMAPLVGLLGMVAVRLRRQLLVPHRDVM